MEQNINSTEPAASVSMLPDKSDGPDAAVLAAEPIIDLDGLCVQFGRRPILKELRSELRGRAIGLLGPNGAGKTTLIHTLLGFHPPSSGTARIFGRDIRSPAAWISPAVLRHRSHFRPGHSQSRKTGSNADRLHARARLVHRQYDLRSFCEADGRALGLARGGGAGTRSRGSVLCWPW